MGNCKSGAGLGNPTETDAVTSSFRDPREEYKMDHKRRGLALIFNQENFLDKKHLATRTGTKADEINLEKRLKDLNFEVKIYNDRNKSDVEEKISEAANADHSDADCFVLVFLSHGEDNYVHAYDDKISIETITSPFRGNRCEGLLGKPKIFILQACRGKIADVSVVSPCSGAPEIVADEGATHTLPAGADFIMCYSTAKGYVSFRDTEEGSWYIQDLCEALQKHGTSLEFTELLTVVNRMVSQREYDDEAQMPCFASMLTRQLYFEPKK